MEFYMKKRRSGQERVSDWGSGTPEDVVSQLDALIARYPSASPRAKADVQAMHADFEHARHTTHTHRKSRGLSPNDSITCRGSNDGRENNPAADQNRRTADTAVQASEACTGQIGYGYPRCRTNDSFLNSNSDLDSRRSSQELANLGTGWSKEERACFGRLRRCCMWEAAAQGGGREAALQLLAAALPGRTLEEVRHLDNGCFPLQPFL